MGFLIRPRFDNRVLMKGRVKGIRVDRSEMKFILKIGVFELALCKMFTSLFPDYIAGTYIMSHWRKFHLPGTIRQSI